MKRVAVGVLFVVASLSMTSCDMLVNLKERIFNHERPASPTTEDVREEVNMPQAEPQQEIEMPQEEAKPQGPRIYSNAYDGFVNVRKAASAKSQILGKLRNGNDYLTQLGTSGNWIMVDWNGTVGYVNKSIVGNKPWKPTSLGVDGNWIQGWYYNGYAGILVFSNGKYCRIHQYGDLNFGTWRFEGNEIVLAAKYVTEYGRDFDWCYVGCEERFTVDVQNKQLDDLKKQTLYSESYYAQFEEEYFGGERIISKEDFNAYKREANKLVKLK